MKEDVVVAVEASLPSLTVILSHFFFLPLVSPL
jgi:hypothetical protein